MKRNGFTIIELISILVILGIIAIVFTNKNSLDINLLTEAEILKSKLRYIQLKALSDDACTSCYGLTTTNNSYTSMPTTIILPGDKSSSYDLSSKKITLTGNNVLFDKWGNASSDSVVKLTLADTKGNTKEILINPLSGLIE